MRTGFPSQVLGSLEIVPDPRPAVLSQRTAGPVTMVQRKPMEAPAVGRMRSRVACWDVSVIVTGPESGRCVPAVGLQRSASAGAKDIIPVLRRPPPGGFVPRTDWPPPDFRVACKAGMGDSVSLLLQRPFQFRGLPWQIRTCAVGIGLAGPISWALSVAAG